MNTRKVSYSLLVVFFLAVVIIIAKTKYYQKNIFAHDNFGYYLYLPATFIYHDLKFTDFKVYDELNKKYSCTPTYYQLMQSPKGGTIIRMYTGISVLVLPAFLVGHGMALLSAYPADGFSFPYQLAMIIFGIILSCLGLMTARKILLRFFPDKIAALTLLVLYIGTNLLFFTTLGNPIPHVYLFNLYLFLIWFTLRWHDNPEWKSGFAIAALLGLIIAIRPSDLIVVFIPLLWNVFSWETLVIKLKLFLSNWKQLLVLGIVFFLFALPQVLYWRFHAGEFIVSVYTDPGSQMRWSEPNVANVLFSFRKGWLIYSPLIVLGLIGIFISIKRHRSFFLFSFLFMALNIYMLSCFTSLVSFGWRAFIQSYAVLLLPLAATIEFILMQKKRISWLIFVFISAFAYLNLVQTWQTGNEVIDGSRMTKAAYIKVLGKWNAQKPEELMRVKRTGFSLDTIVDTHNYRIERVVNESFENSLIENDQSRDSTISFFGKSSFCLPFKDSFFSLYRKPVSEILGSGDHFWVKANVGLFCNDTSAARNGILVITIETKGKDMKYRGISLNMQGKQFEVGKWNELTFDYISPEFMPDDAELKIYFWNKGASKLWIDEAKVYLYTLKQ